MNELVITTSDKDPLPKNNSVVVDGVGVNKSVATGRKTRRVKAILTTPPVDMATIKDVIGVVADLAEIVGFSICVAKGMNTNKNDQSKINVVEGSDESNTLNTKVNKKVKDNHHARKPQKKN